MAKGPEIATNLMFVPKCLEQEVITGNDIIFNSYLYITYQPYFIPLVFC